MNAPHSSAELATGLANFELPPEIVEIRDMARRIVREELLPLEPRYLASDAHCYGSHEEENLLCAFDEATVERLTRIAKETGLWNMSIPEEFGGPGLGLLAQAVVTEELHYTLVPLPHLHVSNILYECRGEQIERILKPAVEGRLKTAFAQTEPNAGSDPGGMMRTKAVKVDGGWLLNGSKMWISQADAADILMTQAVTDPEKRQRGGITMFLVRRDAKGLNIETKGIPTWLGRRPRQYVVHYDDVFVPDQDVLGEVGKGFTLGQKWLTIHDRLMRAPQALGKMQRSLDLSVAWAKQRVTFGKPIAERQAIQWRLVDMHIDIEALRAMTYAAAARGDAGQDVRREASLAKFCGGEWGARTVDHAIQIHGAMGEALELPLTWFYRLLRHMQIGGGTTEMQRMLIARHLLRD